MHPRILKKDQLYSLLDKIINQVPVVGVKQKKNKYVYGKLKEGEEFCPDFDVTVQSPKRFIFPPRETILEFSSDQEATITPRFNEGQKIIWGVHPYDIKAVNVLDAMFKNATGEDRHYLTRRKNTLIVGIDPVRASEKSFWSSMQADRVQEGFDIMLTDIGEEFVVSIGTQRGKDLLDKYGVYEEADSNQIKARDEKKDKLKNLCSSDRKLNFPVHVLPYLLMRRNGAEVWKEKAEKCLSCGSCNLVCPTCYCFDVQDEVSANLTQGERYRVWDGCLLEDFAVVATGENFREERYQRYRHRFYRKGLYIKKAYDKFACVGCGRCVSACLPDIADPVEVYNQVFNYLKGALIL